MIENRDKLIEQLASNIANNANENVLYNYFKDRQIEWLESLVDEDLLEQKDFILGDDC